MIWLMEWGVPALFVLFAVLVVALWNDIRRLPYRRYDKPVEGVNGMYLPAQWKPRDES